MKKKDRYEIVKQALIIVIILLLNGNDFAQGTYTPAPENLKNREWFQDAKFGLFVHWGVYSVLGDGEWVMQQQQIDKQTYEKVASFFNPTEFNAKDWVAMAKSAVMNKNENKKNPICTV